MIWILEHKDGTPMWVWSVINGYGEEPNEYEQSIVFFSTRKKARDYKKRHPEYLKDYRPVKRQFLLA